jgi:hypothetical protein
MTLSRKIKTVSLIAGMTLVLPTYSFAVDITMPNSPDSTATARVGDATPLGGGRMSLGTTLHSTTDLISTSQLDLSNMPEETLLKKVRQYGVNFGYGIIDELDFHLGLAMTEEDITQFSTELMLIDDQREQSIDEHSTVISQGFSHATFALKYSLVKTSRFKLSLLPYGQSGAQKQAAFSVTRSARPSFGWMMMSKLEQPQVFEVLLNAGKHYRQPEWFAKQVLGDEIRYQAAIKTHLNSQFNMFVSGQGRLTQLRYDPMNLASEEHSVLEASDVAMGIGLKLGQMNIAGYFGKGGGAAPIGTGDRFLGMNFSFKMGKRRSRSVLSESDLSLSTSAKKKSITQKPIADDLIQPANLDPIESTDLFADIDKTLEEVGGVHGKNHPFKASPPKKGAAEFAEIDLVTQEIEGLRAAEEKAEQAEAERYRLAEENRRKQGWSDYQKLMKEEETYRQEVRKRIELMPDITDEDFSWSELEDQSLGSQD